LQNLKNRVLHVTGNLDMRTPVHELNVAFKIPYVYDYIIELCRTQAEVTPSLIIPLVRSIEQGEARHRKYKGLKLGDS
jgi:hypothetical protein